ncbi:MAG: DUF333 domain-containing protein [Chloroflexi bacterium]|nr:DUF333 domain-containing protein [Chloroflexota bacterium]
MNTLSSGRYLAIVALLCVAILSGSCVVMSTPAPSVPPATATSVPTVGMANPASVFCKEKGGQLKIEKDATGGEFGTCVFPDGSQCEEWAFFRGECKLGKQPAASPAETAIQLPDGVRCLFAGKGATLVFDGKRLNYTCDKTAGGEQTGLLGNLDRAGFTWTAEKITLGHNDKGFFVKESQKITMEITQVELADGTLCLHAGKGATLAFDGKRLNYTCKVVGADQVGLIGDFTERDGVWSAERATIVRKEGAFALEASAVVSIKALVGSAMPPAPATGELTETLLRNARYELPDLGAIELKDGKYEKKYGEGATQVNRAELATAVLGDLNGDSVNDAAAVLWWNGGGSGTFFNLVALLNDKGTPRQVAVTALGDRTKIESLTIEGGQIVLKMVAHGPKDPLCCPSQATTRTYRLEGNTLKVVSEVVATPAPTPAAGSATDATLSKVKYNPTTYRCENEPQRTMTDKNWQAYAAPEGGQGSDPAKPGLVVTFGLRNKFGNAGEQYEPTAVVIAPDGSTATAIGTLKAADWLYLVYPKDFAGAQSTVPGIYTVVWQIKGGYITCSGFQVVAAQ